MEGVRQIARAAQSWGQQTTVACLDEPGQPFLEGDAFATVPLGPAMFKYGYSPKLAPWLRAHACNFDAVIVNGLWQYSSLAVWRTLHGTKVPYFVFTHGMLDPYFKNAFPLKHLKKCLYWPWAEYRVLRDARGVFFTCEEERALASRSFGLYRAKEFVVGYGTAPSPFARDAASAAFFSSFPTLKEKRLMVFMSRIHRKKGCDLLIEAFSTIVGSDPRWHIVMCGPGEEALVRQLQAQASALGIARHITWTGMLKGERKWGALFAAEVFVLPSHQENFGIAVAEALASGTPVLISDKVNIWREVEADGAGFVAPDTLGGVQQLLQAWIALDPQAQEDMRLAAKNCFNSRFDVQGSARRLSALVQRLAQVGH